MKCFLQAAMSSLSLRYLHLAQQIDASLQQLDALWEQLTVEERSQVLAERNGNCPPAKDFKGASMPENKRMRG